MEETQKTEEEGVKSTKDILEKWNNYYINNDFGIGIKCDSCKKWRKVFQYQDSSEVPEVWTCFMWKIDKDRKGSCRMPSKLTEKDFAANMYSPGYLVVARMTGYPWWPGMVEDCPDFQEYYMPYENAPHEYHINFFGDKPFRSWMKASCIRDFNTFEIPKRDIKRNASLRRSIEQANEALKMSVKERLITFSFANRYKGYWPKIEKNEEVLMPPQKKETRKSTEEVVMPPQKKTRKSAEEVVIPPQKKPRKSAEEVAMPPQKKPRKSAGSRSQLMRNKPLVNRDSHQTSKVCKTKKNKSKLGAGTKRNSMDDPEFQPLGSQDKKIKNNNRSKEDNKDKGMVETKNSSITDRSSTVHNDPRMSSDSEDDHISPEHRAYKEFLDKKYPPLIFEACTDSLSDTGIGNNCCNGRSNLVIDPENIGIFPENEPVFNDENESTISDDEPVFNNENKSTISDDEPVFNNENKSTISDDEPVIEVKNEPTFSEIEPVFNHENKSPFSDDEPVFNNENESTFSSGELVIKDENKTTFSKNEPVIHDENATTFPENDLVIDHDNGATFSENYSYVPDVYSHASFLLHSTHAPKIEQ